MVTLIYKRYEIDVSRAVLSRATSRTTALAKEPRNLGTPLITVTVVCTQVWSPKLIIYHAHSAMMLLPEAVAHAQAADLMCMYQGWRRR